MCAQLVDLDATLRLFDPSIEPDQIRPRRPVHRNAWFGPGECTRLLCDILRTAGEPLTTRTIIDRALAAKGLSAGDAETMRSMAKTIRNALIFFKLEAWSEGQWSSSFLEACGLAEHFIDPARPAGAGGLKVLDDVRIKP